MISSYLNMCHQYPDIVVSFLKLTSPLIHSCHFVIRKLPLANWVINVVTLVMLMTYTEHGVRLSCSAFERLDGFSLQLESRSMMEGHYQVGYLSWYEVRPLINNTRVLLGQKTTRRLHNCIQLQ